MGGQVVIGLRALQADGQCYPTSTHTPLYTPVGLVHDGPRPQRAPEPEQQHLHQEGGRGKVGKDDEEEVLEAHARGEGAGQEDDEAHLAGGEERRGRAVEGQRGFVDSHGRHWVG